MKQRIARRLPTRLRGWVVCRELYRPRLGRDRRQVGVVYGNCQAEPVRRILMSHPGFSQRYRLVRLPPVHEMSRGQLGRLQDLLPYVDLVITQAVNDDYRNLELGTRQILEHTPKDALVIRLPVAYFAGVFPFQAYVNLHDDPIGIPAPLTDYHDLRIMWAAGQGWSVAEAMSRLADLYVDPSWVRLNAESSLAELAARERRLPAPAVRIADHLRCPSRLTRMFHTINHPANDVLYEAARQILAMLGFDGSPAVRPDEFLGHLRGPREPRIMVPLGADLGECWSHWRLPTRNATPEEVVAAHFGLYRRRPKVLAAGLTKHAERLSGTLVPMWRS